MPENQTAPTQVAISLYPNQDSESLSDETEIFITFACRAGDIPSPIEVGITALTESFDGWIDSTGTDGMSRDLYLAFPDFNRAVQFICALSATL